MIIVWKTLFYILLFAPVAVLFLPWRSVWKCVVLLVLLSVASGAYLNSLGETEDSVGLLAAFWVWLLWNVALGVAVLLRALNRLIEPDW